MGNILIIDDEAGIRSILKDVLQDENYNVFLAEDGYKGLDLLNAEPVDLVILDVWLPNMGGIEVLKRIKEEYRDVEVVMISGHANINLAVKAVKTGAFDFLEKPLSLEKIITVVRNALELEKLKQENKQLKNNLFIEDEMIGNHPSMNKIREIIEQSAPTDARVLILGENGTGKELVARAIHLKSKRSQWPFVEVNCAAIPETLIESELFGHEKGAFTSAISRRKGKFEIADRGTLFLDEIADMSLGTQSKVLRVLQELKFERVGGEESISVDVRLIAATNKVIEEEIKAKRFREDLYFRLNVIPIYVPPLRERIEDIEALVKYFMKKFKPPSLSEPKVISKEALDVLKKYSWPGNIRELKNVIERVNIMNDESIVSADILQKCMPVSGKQQTANWLNAFNGMLLNAARDSFEKEFIREKLEDNGYNLAQTAKDLGIYTSSLYSKIRKYSIEIKR